ncbi:uncharacterized protein LOC131150492 [Malania oleifera]|uniref:uncharacterized protein LOC131150492 n=1 Tax=Malania oleifera TaxID=397392 RepID=UPI0025AE3D8F|nr:uncharacterized protein LOC131150492 [Malania oleifera]
MAAQLVNPAAATIAAPPFSTTRLKEKMKKKDNNSVPYLGFQRAWAFHHQGPLDGLHRRSITLLSLGSAVAELMMSEKGASAAARRPPPPPPAEKKEPNAGGVQAKVIASKKRKEAMKEAVARERERGKPVGP